MEYLKPHLSLSQQVALLQQRGLLADASLLASRLRDVGYYRFSAYLHPFRVQTRTDKLRTTMYRNFTRIISITIS